MTTQSHKNSYDMDIEMKNENNERIQRIIHMEEIYDQSRIVVDELILAIQKYLNMENDISELEEYYQSPLWLADFDADSAGDIPKNLKRGILTEDAIYHLLTDKHQLIQMMKSTIIQNDKLYCKMNV